MEKSSESLMKWADLMNSIFIKPFNQNSILAAFYLKDKSQNGDCDNAYILEDMKSKISYEANALALERPFLIISSFEGCEFHLCCGSREGPEPHAACFIKGKYCTDIHPSIESKCRWIFESADKGETFNIHNVMLSKRLGTLGENFHSTEYIGLNLLDKNDINDTNSQGFLWNIKDKNRGRFILRNWYNDKSKLACEYRGALSNYHYPILGEKGQQLQLQPWNP